MIAQQYKPPFVWFGGKSSVAETVWSAFGDLGNYVEPFFGSGAILFLRPDGPGPIETVNDADGFVANFWRAMQHDSDAVADFADWPVNEADLHARHLWLLGQRERITERLMGDADFFDAKVAGWWVWGINCWIGSGWCSGKGPWVSDGGVLTLRNTGQGVNRKRPHLGDTGQGVNRQLPHLGTTGQGVNRKRLPIAAGGSASTLAALPRGSPGSACAAGTGRACAVRALRTGIRASRGFFLIRPTRTRPTAPATFTPRTARPSLTTCGNGPSKRASGPICGSSCAATRASTPCRTIGGRSNGRQGVGMPTLTRKRTAKAG